MESYEKEFHHQIHSVGKKLSMSCRGGSASKIVPGLWGGTIFWYTFLLHIWAIWKNDPFSKSEKAPPLMSWTCSV